MNESSFVNRTKPKIAIIGGGLAGLTTAFTLNNTFSFSNISIFEADFRLGGRINSTLFGSNETLIEMGAQWLHVASSNPLTKLAKTEGILQENCPYEDFYDLKPGVIIATAGDLSVTKEEFQTCSAVFQNILEQFDDDSKQEQAIRFYENSVGACFKEEYLKHFESLKLTDDQMKRVKILYQHLVMEACFDNGCNDLKDVSLEADFIWGDDGDQNIQLPSGYSSFIKFFESRTKSCHIHLSSSVINVNIIERNSEAPKVCLHILTNGSSRKEEFDHVVVTSSLGVLQKHHDTMFSSPPLSSNKITAINSLSFGIVEKIFIEFSERIIPSDCPEIQYIVERGELVSDRNWWETISMWYAFGSSGTVFMGVVIGKAAEFVGQLPIETVGKTCHAQFEKMLKRKLPPLKSIIITEWHKNPHISGSYTYCPRDTPLTAFQEILEPIIDVKAEKPLILFAGEHTHLTQYAATQGAYLSGIREATRIADFWSG